MALLQKNFVQGRTPTCRALVLSLVLVAIAGCGSGAGGDAPSTSAATLPPTPIVNSIAVPSENVLAISVNSGLARNVNHAYASVTICEPGSSSSCQTIDQIIVDTGSSGLRILSSAISAPLSLPQVTDSSGDPIAECTQFAGGFSWGPLKRADVNIAGEKASSLAIHVIGEPGFAEVPARCAGTGAPLNSLYSLRANGVLGVGAFRQDCGSACAQSASPGIYYACPPSGCQSVVRPVHEQVQNPVSKFARDNNGIILELPAIAEDGAAGASGALVFGIGTRANNGLGSASVLTLNPATGALTTKFNDGSISESILDSGSNALYFQDSSIPLCNSTRAAGCYCPTSTRQLTAVIQGANGINAAVSFSVANAEALMANNPGFTAFANLASPRITYPSFAWGLPFFYGRNVYVAFEGANTPAGPGPYVAF